MDRKGRVLQLSIKAKDDAEMREALDDYQSQSSSTSSSGTTQLGALLREQLEGNKSPSKQGQPDPRPARFIAGPAVVVFRLISVTHDQIRTHRNPQPRQPHLKADDVDLAVKSLLEMMGGALAHGERIEIRGFGSFSLHYRPPRLGRNPEDRRFGRPAGQARAAFQARQGIARARQQRDPARGKRRLSRCSRQRHGARSACGQATVSAKLAAPMHGAAR